MAFQWLSDFFNPLQPVQMGVGKNPAINPGSKSRNIRPFFRICGDLLEITKPPPCWLMGGCAVALAQLEGRGWQSPVFMEEQWQVQDTPKHSLAKNRKRWTRTRRAGGDVDLWVRNTFTRGAPWMGKKSPLRTERAKVPLFWVHGSHWFFSDKYTRKSSSRISLAN